MRTSFLEFVFSLASSTAKGEFTLQAWALNNESAYSNGKLLPNKDFAKGQRCGIMKPSKNIVCSPRVDATVFQLKSQGAGLYKLTARSGEQDSAFGVRNPGDLCGTNSNDSSVGCPALVHVSGADEEANGFNAQFVIEVLRPGQKFGRDQYPKLYVGDVMRAGGSPYGRMKSSQSRHISCAVR